MSDIKKILVTGAGIAGPTLCYWLQKYGFNPILIEKSSILRKGGQGIDIRGIAVDIVKKMGIYEQIREMRTQMVCGRQIDLMGNILHEEKSEKFGYRQDEDVEILRGDLVEILMNQIETVPCHFDQTIDNIEQNDDGVSIYFKDGRIEDYDLVIGADGVRSSIRRMVFDKPEYEMVNLWAGISIFSIPNYLELSHTAIQCESSQKAIFMNSDREPEIAQVGLIFCPEQDLSNLRDEKKQMQLVKDIFHDFGWEAKKILELMSDSNDFYFDSVTQVKMPSWTKGRIALIGDAGYCASPFSGQGSNLALLGAYILAGELKAAEGNYQQAFNRYHKLLRSFVEANQEFGAWVREAFLTPDELSREAAEARTNEILQRTQIISNAITLPDYKWGSG